MVPNGWEVKHLSELASKISDGIHSTPIYAESSDIYFINGNNLKSGSIVFQESTKCVDENDAANHHKDLGNRTILMSINGTIGNLAYYRGENVVLGKSACYINIKQSTDLDFIYYVLSDHKTRAFYESELTGTTIRNLSLKSIKSTKISTPPLPEQKKIAKILSTWDKAISTTEQLLTNSQQQKKALMQQLLTGRKRFSGFFGEWPNGHLVEMARISKGKALSGKDLVDGKYPVIAGGKTSPYLHNAFTHKNVITISASGAYAGYVSFHPYEIWASDCSVVQAKAGSDTKFIYHLLTHLQAKIYSLQSGGAQPHIYPKDLEAIKVSIPPVAEQQKIAAVLAVADQEIEVLRQKLDCLKQEKNALMQQLLTGKRRVKVEEAA